MGATTDSFGEVHYDKKERPGISNLLDILAALTDTDIKEIVSRYAGQTQYGELKKDVADAVSSFLSDFQSKLSQIDDAEIIKKLEASEIQMNKVANSKLLSVQKALGLRL
jgi:tryptophanyl-tRNA synthetase